MVILGNFGIFFDEIVFWCILWIKTQTFQISEPTFLSGDADFHELSNLIRGRAFLFTWLKFGMSLWFSRIFSIQLWLLFESFFDLYFRKPKIFKLLMACFFSFSQKLRCCSSSFFWLVSFVWNFISRSEEENVGSFFKILGLHDFRFLFCCKMHHSKSLVYRAK